MAETRRMKTPIRFALEMSFKLFIFMVGIQQLDATEVNCSVTKNGTGYLYGVPEFEGCNCTSRWFDDTNQSLAYVGEGNERHWDQEQALLVTIRTLQTTKFLTPVHYSRTCLPDVKHTELTKHTEDVQLFDEKITATCTSDNMSHSSEVDEGANLSMSKEEQAAVAVVVFLVSVGALVGLLFFLKKQRSKSHTPVKTGDAEDRIPCSNEDPFGNRIPINGAAED